MLFWVSWGLPACRMWWGELVAPWCADVLWIPYGMIYDPLEATTWGGDGPHDVMRWWVFGKSSYIPRYHSWWVKGKLLLWTYTCSRFVTSSYCVRALLLRKRVCVLLSWQYMGMFTQSSNMCHVPTWIVLCLATCVAETLGTTQEAYSYS
jgi:hypothetical protein